MRNATRFATTSSSDGGAAAASLRSDGSRSALDGGEVDGGEASPRQRALVHRDGAAVQLDGALERRERDRQQPALQRVADQEQVGADRVAEQRGGDLGGVEEVAAVVARGGADRSLHRVRREIEIRARRELGGRRDVAIHDRGGAALAHAQQRVGAGGHDDVGAEHEIAAARRDARRVQILGAPRHAHVARHRAVLLREAGHVEHRRALPFEMRRHPDQRADRHDAAAADAGDEHVPRPREIGFGRRGQLREEIVAARIDAPSSSTLRSSPPTIVTKLGQ